MDISGNQEISSTTTTPQKSPDVSLTYPIYHRDDYIGAIGHLVIFAIDGFVIFLMLLPLTILNESLTHQQNSSIPPELLNFITYGLWGLVAWLYLAVLKPSPYRSLGYRVVGAKIITINGNPPSPWCMTLRLLWLAMSYSLSFPVSLFTDLLWTTMERERQMLRDLVFRTRLIRVDATPIGIGRVSRCLFTGLGICLSYAQVRATVPD